MRQLLCAYCNPSLLVIHHKLCWHSAYFSSGVIRHIVFEILCVCKPFLVIYKAISFCFFSRPATVLNYTLLRNGSMESLGQAGMGDILLNASWQITALRLGPQMALSWCGKVRPLWEITLCPFGMISHFFFLILYLWNANIVHCTILPFMSVPSIVQFTLKCHCHSCTY